MASAANLGSEDPGDLVGHADAKRAERQVEIRGGATHLRAAVVVVRAKPMARAALAHRVGEGEAAPRARQPTHLTQRHVEETDLAPLFRIECVSRARVVGHALPLLLSRPKKVRVIAREGATR